MSTRDLLAVSIKHTEYKWKFGDPCTLWGWKRTKDDEERCFGGYTTLPVKAELYTAEEFSSKYPEPWMKTDESVKVCVGFCKKYKDYDTVLVKYEDYIKYCELADLPLGEEVNDET